jgi:hypothetical protein
MWSSTRCARCFLGQRHWNGPGLRVGQAAQQPQQTVPPLLMPSRAASRAPARPASATAIAVSAFRSNDVRRARGAASICGCSANVRAGHCGLSQKNRRTRNRSCTCLPYTGASASRPS